MTAFRLYVVKCSSNNEKSPIKSDFSIVFESLRPHHKDYLKTTNKVGTLGSFFVDSTGDLPTLYILFIYSLSRQKSRHKIEFDELLTTVFGTKVVKKVVRILW